MMSGQTLTGVLLMLISLGMLVHGLFYYEPLTLAETQVRAGVLASDPKFDETSGDTNKEYIEVQFVGSDEKYRFIDCSHMDFVVDNMKQVSKGDSLVLRVVDDRYARVAWSPKLDTILGLKSYNQCTHWQAKQWTPKVWGGALIISIAIIVNTFIQSLGNNRFMDIPKNEVADIGLPLEFRGDFWTFIIRNSTFPLIALGIGINNLIRGHSSDHLLGYFLTVVGIGWAIQFTRSGIAKIYCVDNEGVRVTDLATFGGLRTREIRYEDIEEVSVRAGLIERWRGLGSLHIVSDKKDSDNDPIEIGIIGIPKAHHIARVIFDISSAKRSKAS